VSALGDWLALVASVLAYGLVLWALHQRGLLGPERSLSLFGPALMWKTRRGRHFLDRAGRWVTFWNLFADLGIALALLAMVSMVVLLTWEAVLATTIPSASAPQPAEALGLPGINPYIPLGYGIVALVIGVGLHELCHGVVARANKIPVKTLGILFLVVPIGAFVEQDEESMNRAPARRRDRVAAAGVMANFGLAVVFFLILSLVMSTSVHPAAQGVPVASVFPGSPAQNGTLSAGDLIMSLNGTSTPDGQALRAALAQARPGETVPITWFDGATQTFRQGLVTLSAESHYVSGLAGNTTAERQAFLGITEYPLTPQAEWQLLRDPVGPLSSPLATGTLTSSNPFQGGLLFLVLPFLGQQPIVGDQVGFFHVSGPLASLPEGGVWYLVNGLYWLVWMNLLLGLSNSLPAVPFDGGYLFRDVVGGVVRRARSRWTRAQVDAAVGRLSTLATLLILFLILWQFVGPHL
jgi:membrane-associated protease RseP (regulator of RpoE activity)